MINATDARVFLFLQGPHGPFFRRLGAALRRQGARVLRVGFNAGDAFFWAGAPGYIPYRGTAADWPETFRALAEREGVTDLVLYGDVRAIHASAIAHAKSCGITVHVFEEGYLRPYWLTYERGGSNGHSRLMRLDLAKMRASRHGQTDPALPPAHWGDLRQHVFYGAVYHGIVMLFNHGYRAFRSHRAVPVFDEFRLYLRRLMMMPVTALRRMLATAAIKRGGFPYHLTLLQLEHDSSFQRHSPFATQAEFVDTVMATFAKGAPPDHHLVFKAHPLEDGRGDVAGAVARAARAHGVSGRVHFLPGGKLAHLLNGARSAVTVNSTAAQQALWRGLPVKAFGEAVYAKPELVSPQPLHRFFARPRRPNRAAYRAYRRFLLATSQVQGGFYSAAGRNQAIPDIVALILTHEDPYDVGRRATAARQQHKRPLEMDHEQPGLAFPPV